MPRIDPLQLLTCLSVLLAPNGGIKSALEVRRIASLMGKFSKKLVSKCIYIQILKCSETELLGQFMETDGWMLTYSWLQDAVASKNWPLVQEILELFLLCPVDVERLKSNSAPKLVKSLSKEGSHEGVQILAAKLVEQWLKVVKGESVVIPSNMSVIPTMTAAGLVGRDASQQLLIDPSNSSYVDNLAMDVELNGIGGNEGADHVDVDDIIPTIKMDHNDHLMANNNGELALSFPNSCNNAMNEGSDATGRKSDKGKEETLKFKISVKDGLTSLAKMDPSSVISGAEKKKREDGNSIVSSEKEKRDKDRDGKARDRTKDKSSSSSHRSGSSKSKSSSSSSNNNSHKSGSKTSSSSSSRDKDRDRHKSSSSRSSSSSSRDKQKSSRDKDKVVATVTQAEKDKDTLAKVMAPTSIDKLGKIPKKPKTEDPAKAGSEASAQVVPPPPKKSSISIEVRKDADNRPKTVKTFNSQFRNHGLVEEAPPPPSRKTLKKPSSTASSPMAVTSPVPATTLSQPKLTSPAQTTTSALKRSSPPPSAKESPTEKKLKLDIMAAGADEKQEKPGGIKLIAPRSKPQLIESDMFMDALCSSASTTKKDLKSKKKRRASTSKEGETPDTPPPESPKLSAAPMKFYQDILEENEEGKEKASKGEEEIRTDEDGEKVAKDDNEEEKGSEGKTTDNKMEVDEEKATASDEGSGDAEEEVDEPRIRVPGPGCGVDGPPGVLVIHRRKGPKKSVRWQENLEDVKFFVLDETERVNVTKTFTDMKQMERFGERENFLMARKLQNEDNMTEQTPWMPLLEVEDVPPFGEVKSKEKAAQLERERTVLQALYFHHAMIPDTSSEPDLEPHKLTDPVLIPLEDGNQNSVNDFTKQGWPDPKETPPHMGGAGGFNGMGGFNEPPGNQNFGPFNMNFGNPQGGVPGMQNPWQMGQPQFQGNNPNQMPFNNALNPDEIKMALQFNGMNTYPGQNFMPPNFNGINAMNLPAMGGGPGPRGPWGFRPSHPGGGAPWRNNGPPGMMNNMGGGPPPRRDWVNNNGGSQNTRLCKMFKKGYCKKGDKCNFLHPGGGGGFNRI